MGVDTNLYLKSMRYRWSSLGKATNPPLEAAWTDMAATFNQHLEGTMEKWSVLQLPTGAGKTQGLAVYCSELVKLQKRNGILIVTRFTKEADILAALINELSKKTVALAQHSKLKDNAAIAAEFPILIVTHSAYLVAIKEANGSVSTIDRWKELIEWKHGLRRLSVIDETLNTVNQVTLSLDEIRFLRGAIPYNVEVIFPEQVAMIDAVIEKFKTLASSSEQVELNIEYWADIPRADLMPLSKEVAKIQSLDFINSRSLLSRLSFLLTTWTNYAKQGNLYTLSTAQVTLPPYIQSAVILDATASRSYVYELLRKVTTLKEIPEGIRNYQYVRMYIHYGQPVGRSSLLSLKPTHFINTLKQINPQLKRNASFLLCLHASVEEKISKTVKQHYPSCKIAHWGEIDGKNDWQELDTIILYGLPYLGSVIPACAIRAYKHWYAKAQGKYNPFIEYKTGDSPYELDIQIEENLNEASDYESGHIEVSVIQAINRIRCRASIDNEGNCLPCNVYLFLRDDGELEKDIIAAIRKLMPNIQIFEDKSLLSHESNKIPKTGQRIITFLSKTKLEKSPVADVMRGAKVSQRTMERYIKEYNDGTTSFAKRMHDIGITKYEGAKGRGAKPYFIKKRHT